ncbi:hypothetical protein KIH74_30145 [Kineosporia sp. J2-2]|uniref:Lipoprotein n=1 Tax=Kineosporia corallincola TaxID=2835133 RepID=A0ABS5TRB3_9ACTN|nr:hypothetical protein [Kineosporia corallincola]MBT0773244.1 hypothetical protein [Kineosporia corallincola]
MAITVGVAGCSSESVAVGAAGSEAVSSAVATTTSTALSPRDEAVAAAKKTYEQYTLVANDVAHGGGSDTAALDDVAVGEALLAQKNIAKLLSEKKYRGVGDIEVVSMEAVKVNLKTDPDTYTVPEVILNVCEDQSNIDAVNEAGKSVRGADSPDYRQAKISVSYYPDRGGVDGWFVNSDRDTGTEKC